MNYKEVVVDLETLDTSNTAVILSIGAVAFNREDNDSWGDFTEARSFYQVLELDTQKAAGLTTSKNTELWWAKQSAEAKKVFDEPKVDTKTALEQFYTFCSGTRSLWGNGNMFDNAIIRNACKKLNTPYPYKFWEDFDMRTLLSLANGRNRSIQFEGIEHNALDDAKFEVLQIQSAYRTLKG